MPNLLKLPTWLDKTHIYAVVETPRGSRCKLEYDPKHRVFTLAKPLLAGLTYPYDWGFIPSTKAEDGDPLDVLIIHDAATYPGLVLTCKPIGVLEVLQSSKGKGKNIVIEFRWAEMVDQLPELAAELVRMNADVIFAMSSTEVEPTRQATKTIPIVFAPHR